MSLCFEMNVSCDIFIAFLGTTALLEREGFLQTEGAVMVQNYLSLYSLSHLENGPCVLT